MASCFLHSLHTNGIEVILNAGSSKSISVSLPSATYPILAVTEMVPFLSSVGLSSFLLEGKINETVASTRVLRPTPKDTLIPFA